MRDVPHTQAPGTAALSAEKRAEFRQMMGRFTTGVCVVSVQGEANSIAAMTVNSFVSVSLDPMLVSWSLQNSSSQFDLYAQSARFAVSILAFDHADIARRYATRGDTQLRREDFVQSDSGLPVISGALAHFECDRHSDYLVGDHTMIFGEVTGLGAQTVLGEPVSPLGFFNGQFCSIEQ